MSRAIAAMGGDALSASSRTRVGRGGDRVAVTCKAVTAGTCGDKRVVSTRSLAAERQDHEDDRRPGTQTDDQRDWHRYLFGAPPPILDGSGHTVADEPK